MNERWGTDLRLLRSLKHQNDRQVGRDLSVVIRSESGREEADLETLSGAENLIQALLLRFLTHRGELAVLGHPNYGSRLHELIGEPNTETNRNRAKLFVLEMLQAEPRVKEIISVVVTSKSQLRRDIMDIDIWLKAIDSDTPINLVFPFFLDGGGAI